MKKTKERMLQIASISIGFLGVLVAIFATVYEEFPKAWWILRFGAPLGIILFFAGISLWNIVLEKSASN